MANYNITPLTKVNSKEVSKHILSLFKFKRGILRGLDPTLKNSGSYLYISPGVALFDDMIIEFTSGIKIEPISSSGNEHDGLFRVIIKYPDPVIQQPYDEFPAVKPIAVVIPVDSLVTINYPYVYLCSVYQVGNTYQNLSLVDPDDPINFNRIYVASHNALSGLQGGNALTKEYYHLSAYDKTNLNIIVNFFNNLNKDHNALANLYGGNNNERFHFTGDEYSALGFVLAGDINSWHNSVIYLNGGSINADKLDDKSVEDFALAAHSHDHSTLTNLQNCCYHVTQAQLTDFRNIVNNSEAPNALIIGGKQVSDLSLSTHTHDHNNFNNIQGGSQFQRYHLTQAQWNAFYNEVTNPSSIDTDKLQGYDSSAFALVNHTHDHNQLTELQGGNNADEFFHFTSDQYSYITDLYNGFITVTNSDKLDNLHATDFASSTHTHDHNSLTNIQGGIPGERYHLTSVNYSALTNANSPSATNVIVTQADINVEEHNDVNGIQGGDSVNKEYYHLDENQLPLLTDNNDASTIHSHSTYYDKTISDSLYVNITGDTLTSLNLNSNNITSVNDTITDNLQLVTKRYVDDKGNSFYNEHNEYSGIQGGDLNNNEAFHLTSANLDELTLGNNTTIHNHDSIYYTKTDSDSLYVKLAEGNLNGIIDMNSNAITNIYWNSTYIESNIATKGYVDDKASQANPYGVPSGYMILGEGPDNNSLTNNGYSLYISSDKTRYNLCSYGPNIDSSSSTVDLLFFDGSAVTTNAYMDITHVYACIRHKPNPAYDEVHYGYVVYANQYSDSNHNNFVARHVFVLKVTGRNIGNGGASISVIKHSQSNDPNAQILRYTKYGTSENAQYYYVHDIVDNSLKWFGSEVDFKNYTNAHIIKTGLANYNESATVYGYDGGAIFVFPDGKIGVYNLNVDSYTPIGVPNYFNTSHNTTYPTLRKALWPVVKILTSDEIDLGSYYLYFLVLGMYNPSSDNFDNFLICYDTNSSVAVSGFATSTFYDSLLRRGYIVNGDLPYYSVSVGKRQLGLVWGSTDLNDDGYLLSMFMTSNGPLSTLHPDYRLTCELNQDIPTDSLYNVGPQIIKSAPTNVNGHIVEKLYIKHRYFSLYLDTARNNITPYPFVINLNDIYTNTPNFRYALYRFVRS